MNEKNSMTGITQIVSRFTGHGMIRESILFWAIVGCLAVGGLLVGDNYTRHIFILVFIWCIVIAGWDLILGYAGIFNYAQLVFFAVGAYASAMLSIYAEVTPLLAIACAGGIGVVAGLLIGLPCLRLKGEYVALFTFAVHLAMPPVILLGQGIGMGGNTGLLGVPYMNIFGLEISPIDKLSWYWITLFFGSVCVYIIYFVVLRGKMGLAFVALRDAEDFAQSIGVNEFKYKILAFVVAASFAAVAGGLYAHYTSVVTPKILGTEFFLMAMVMMAIGGMGKFPGAIVGVFIVIIGNEFLRSFDEYRLFLLGIAVVITVLFMPEGVVTSRFMPWSKRQKAP